jgi:ribonuclease Z
MVEIIPLGTGSAIPTRHRHLSSTALVRGGTVLLFDCGEATQFRLLEARIKRSRVDAIFITHLHGDHLFGLVGLVATLALLNRTERLCVVGPAGLAALFQTTPGLATEGLPFVLDVLELREDLGRAVVYETPEFYVEARPLEHRVFTAGYRFQEKSRPGRLDADRARALGVTEYGQFRMLKEGRTLALPGGRSVAPADVLGPERKGVSFAYVTDTRPCDSGVLLARGADLVYHDATFTTGLQDQAEKTGHSTAREAAEVAHRAGAARLLLGHFSARYDDADVLVQEARVVFQNTEAAQELRRYALEPYGVHAS